MTSDALRRHVLTVAGSGTPLEKRAQEIVESAARCAPSAAAAVFEPGLYDPRAVARAQELWRVRMASEHRSTAVFSALAAQLIEAGAPLDTQLVVLEMAQDELRHTQLCARVLAGLGAAPECEAERALAPLPAHRDCSREECALRNVVYGSCLSEMVNAARFVDALEVIRDPFVRDATRQLLADEVLHGQFGFYYLEACRPWLEAQPAVRASLARYLRHAFVVLERSLAGHAAPPPSADELAVGVPDTARMREVFYQTIEHAVVPALERFGIDAGTAWRERRLASAAAGNELA